MKRSSKKKIKSRQVFWTIFSSSVISLAFFILSCSLVATRPTQSMSDTWAAIRAAKEVQADTLAPELFRQSTEWFVNAKKEYRLKNYHLAQAYADTSRHFAERAELESIRNGGNRTEAEMPDPFGNIGSKSSNPDPSVKDEPYPYPTPEGASVDSIEEKNKAAATQQQNLANPPANAPINGAPNNPSPPK